jgi:hypothetical protein
MQAVEEFSPCFVRVADDQGLERFAALGVSGWSVRYRPRRVAVVSGADIGLEENETPEELAVELGEEARMLREQRLHLPEDLLVALPNQVGLRLHVVVHLLFLLS